MSNTTNTPLEGAAADFQQLAEKQSTVVAFTAPYTTLGELIDAYMAQYAGRDPACGYRLASWQARLGAVPLTELNDDHVFTALEEFAETPARIYAGRDAEGRTILRAKGRRSPSTIARYHAALTSVLQWGMRKRRTPKGFENPCRKVARPVQRPGVIRFLSDPERDRLLSACRQSRWSRLYLFVLFALTTGARRNEVAALRWRNIDSERAVAYVETSKNNESRVLPLLPAVLEELARFRTEDEQRLKLGAPHALIFASRQRPDIAYHAEAVWQIALKTATVRNFRFHDLRHTTASYLAQSGASLLEIADVLGHRELSVTRRYSHLTITSKVALVHRVLGSIK